jgi:hypothetical protein
MTTSQGVEALRALLVDARDTMTIIDNEYTRNLIDKIDAALAVPAPPEPLSVDEALSGVSIRRFGKGPDEGPKLYTRADVDVLCAIAIAAHEKGLAHPSAPVQPAPEQGEQEGAQP